MQTLAALPLFEPLTPAEKVVLTMHAEGLKGPAIALRLIKSKYTPKNHVQNLKKKLRVQTIAGAITRAHQLGEIDINLIKIEEISSLPKS